ncbi:hypothetical protein JL722_633 [Aureococcus anophagefferens]|nr:hypothetical protein JL722_633 [Aureococcus anophagefferens]
MEPPRSDPVSPRRRARRDLAVVAALGPRRRVHGRLLPEASATDLRWRPAAAQSRRARLLEEVAKAEVLALLGVRQGDDAARGRVECAHFRVRGRPAAAQIDGNARPDDERPFGFVCKNGRRRWCAPAHERRCVACGARTRSPAVDGASRRRRAGFFGFRDGARCRRSDAGALPHVADLALAGVSERGLRLAARLCPNLKTLDVSGCAGGGDAAVLAALLERCPKLETLDVGAVGAAGLRTLAALGLRSLSVGDFATATSARAALDGAPPTLVSLRVDCHHFCFAGWAAPPPASAARGLRSVERLRVASAWGDPGWLWGLAPNVAALSLAGCRSVGDAPGLRGLARLAELDVSGSPYVTGFAARGPPARADAARLDVSDCASMFCVDFVTGSPRSSSPEIVVKCYYGDAKGVADAIAAGADLLEVACPAVYSGNVERRGQPDPECGIALHYACFYAHIDCVRELLATGCHEQLDWRRAETGATPLLLLCQHAGQAACSVNPHQLADTLACVELLLEAGAALEPRTTTEHTNPRPVGAPSAEAMRGRVREDPSLPRDWRVSPSGLTALDFAYLSGDGDLVRALEDAAGLRYSARTHRRFRARRGTGGGLAPSGLPGRLRRAAAGLGESRPAVPRRADEPGAGAAARRRRGARAVRGLRRRATVRVVGLAKATQHNGKLGRVCKKAGPEGRVGVALDLGGAVARQLGYWKGVASGLFPPGEGEGVVGGEIAERVPETRPVEYLEVADGGTVQGETCGPELRRAGCHRAELSIVAEALPGSGIAAGDLMVHVAEFGKMQSDDGLRYHREQRGLTLLFLKRAAAAPPRRAAAPIASRAPCDTRLVEDLAAGDAAPGGPARASTLGRRRASSRTCATSSTARREHAGPPAQDPVAALGWYLYPSERWEEACTHFAGALYAAPAAPGDAAPPCEPPADWSDLWERSGGDVCAAFRGRGNAALRSRWYADLVVEFAANYLAFCVHARELEPPRAMQRAFGLAAPSRAAVLGDRGAVPHPAWGAAFDRVASFLVFMFPDQASLKELFLSYATEVYELRGLARPGGRPLAPRARELQDAADAARAR